MQAVRSARWLKQLCLLLSPLLLLLPPLLLLLLRGSCVAWRQQPPVAFSPPAACEAA
jgi:hypothetical protein